MNLSPQVFSFPSFTAPKMGVSTLVTARGSLFLIWWNFSPQTTFVDIRYLCLQLKDVLFRVSLISPTPFPLEFLGIIISQPPNTACIQLWELTKKKKSKAMCYRHLNLANKTTYLIDYSSIYHVPSGCW